MHCTRADEGPRAAAPHTRLKMIAAVREAGVPVGVLVAPIPDVPPGRLFWRYSDRQPGAER